MLLIRDSSREDVWTILEQMAKRGGQMPSDGTEQTRSGMATATTGLVVNATSEGAEGGTQSANE